MHMAYLINEGCCQLDRLLQVFFIFVLYSDPDDGFLRLLWMASDEFGHLLVNQVVDVVCQPAADFLVPRLVFDDAEDFGDLRLKADVSKDHGSDRLELDLRDLELLLVDVENAHALLLRLALVARRRHRRSGLGDVKRLVLPVDRLLGRQSTLVLVAPHYQIEES